MLHAHVVVRLLVVLNTCLEDILIWWEWVIFGSILGLVLPLLTLIEN